MVFVMILRPEIMQDLGHTKSHIFYKFWVELAFTNIFQTIDWIYKELFFMCFACYFYRPNTGALYWGDGTIMMNANKI